MNDTAVPIVEVVEELVAQLRHADALIDEQAQHIAALEAEVTRLQMMIEALAAAA